MQSGQPNDVINAQQYKPAPSEIIYFKDNQSTARIQTQIDVVQYQLPHEAFQMKLLESKRLPKSPSHT